MNFNSLKTYLTPEFVASVVTIVVLIAVVAVRTISRGNVQVTLNDAIIAAIAAGLTLLMSGFISKLVVGTGGVTIETTKMAILNAGAQSVAAQVSPLPVAPFQQAEKEGLSQLPSFVQQRLEGLDFDLGGGGYIPDITQQYLETLGKYPWFRGMVLRVDNGKLLGIIEVRTLLTLIGDQSSGVTFEKLVRWINNGAPEDREQLARLPGFVSSSNAVTKGSDKRDVLEKMEKLRSDWLPVVDEQGRLVGTVERARLVSSLILDVMNRLAPAGSQQ